MAKISVAKPVKAEVTKKRKPKLNKKKSKNKIINVKPAVTSHIKPPMDTSEVKLTVEKETTVASQDKKVAPSLSTEQFAKRFPVFKDEELIKKFLGVTMTNNQKGRIRQTLRDSLKGSSDQLLPDIIHNRVQAIVRENKTLTDAELRKIRILYNMLKTTLVTPATEAKVKKNKKGKNKERKVKRNKNVTEVKNETEIKDEAIDDKDIEMSDNIEIKDTKDVVEKQVGDDDKDVKVEKNKKQEAKCVKGPKRYVVFVGNLPLDIDKERIMQHFKDFKDYILDVRIPKQLPNKKSGIAYVELKNELCYELALSKHHTMLENKRINVHYTAQKNSKISKTEAKGKAAKLVALQRSGKLAGSVPLNRKRSQRRMKAKQARARLEAEA